MILVRNITSALIIVKINYLNEIRKYVFICKICNIGMYTVHTMLSC